MPNGFTPTNQFEQFVYDELKHQTERLQGLPCEEHNKKIEANCSFRNKAIGAYIVLGTLVGGGIIGLLWTIFKGTK